MKKIIVCTFMILSFSVVGANLFTIENIGQTVDREIESTGQALEKIESTGYEWSLKTIRFRLRPSFGLDIPWLAKAKVKPEIELYWEK